MLLKTIINVYLLWKQNFNMHTDEHKLIHYKEKEHSNKGRQNSVAKSDYSSTLPLNQNSNVHHTEFS